MQFVELTGVNKLSVCVNLDRIVYMIEHPDLIGGTYTELCIDRVNNSIYVKETIKTILEKINKH